MRAIIARTHLPKMRTDSGPLAGKSSFGDGVKGDGTAWYASFWSFASRCQPRYGPEPRGRTAVTPAN